MKTMTHTIRVYFFNYKYHDGRLRTLKCYWSCGVRNQDFLQEIQSCMIYSNTLQDRGDISDYHIVTGED